MNHQYKSAFVVATVMAAVILAGCGQETAQPVASATAPSSGPTPVTIPVLGRPAGDFDADSQGFGEVRPATVFNGGDPTGLITHITWSSWGDSAAIGTGMGNYEPPNQPVVDSIKESATIVAFDLGTCGGTLMYQAVEWYFPQHGQKFNPSQYEDICTGSYVGWP
jgi:hypothetical protein